MNIALNKLILSAMAAIGFFLIVINMFEAETLIYITNSAFAGAMVAILVAYWRLVWNALAGIRPYDRVRQMTLGFVLCWVAYCISVFTSIYFHSADLSGANTASLWTTYNFPMGIQLGGGLSYVDRRYGNTSNTVMVPAYTRFDAAIPSFVLSIPRTLH